MPRTYEPIPMSLCGCPACLKKAGYPGINYPSTTEYAGVGGHYGTRQWNQGGRGRLFLGMELELSNAHASAWRHACSYLDRKTLAEVKPDGGMMELTSHPMSPRFFMAHYPWQLLGELQALGVSGQPDRGGIHVHANKTAFDGADHIYNWMRFMYANPAEMRALGGRTRNHFQEIPPQRDMMRLAQLVARQVELFQAKHEAATHAIRRQGLLVYRPEDRARIRRAEAQQIIETWSRSGEAEAINVRRHPATFEVRFPGAAIEPPVVKGRLQLVAAMVEYTRGLEGTGEANLRFPLFADWVASNRAYPQLRPMVAAL